MNNLPYLICYSLISIFFLTTGCGAAGEATPGGAARGTATVASPVDGWTQLVREAQKEGSVNLYADVLGAATKAIKEGFRSKYGITLETIEGRPAEVVAKVSAERRAGLFLADVGLSGNSTFYIDIKPLQMTVPLGTVLELPEVTDPSRWRNGKVPYLDRAGHALTLVAGANRPSIYNTDLIKAGDITSFLDYLKPQWKGKIVLSDPAIAGSGPSFFALMATQIYGMEKTQEILRQLSRQDPMLTRDQRLLLEWVARGKYPVGIGQSTSMLTEFRRLGAPVAFAILKEPPFLGTGSGNIFMYDKAPHPHAARLFVNWMASKEGASLFAPAHGYPSLRLDVATDGFDPAILPPPGSVPPDEEYLKALGEIRKIAGSIFQAGGN